MSRKKGRAPRRAGSTAPRPPVGGAPAATPATPATRPQAPASTPPRITFSSSPARPASRRPGQLTLGADPGIPISQVPYFIPDLKKVAITGVAMLALLLLGSRLIPLVIR